MPKADDWPPDLLMSVTHRKRAIRLFYWTSASTQAEEGNGDIECDSATLGGDVLCVGSLFLVDLLCHKAKEFASS